MKNHAVIYCRTLPHEEHESSLKMQERNCRSFAKLNDLDVSAVYSDCLIDDSEPRPEYARMAQYAIENKVNIVVAVDIPRIARSAIELAVAVEELGRNGIQLLTTADGNITESFERSKQKLVDEQASDGHLSVET